MSNPTYPYYRAPSAQKLVMGFLRWNAVPKWGTLWYLSEIECGQDDEVINLTVRRLGNILQGIKRIVDYTCFTLVNLPGWNNRSGFNRIQQPVADPGFPTEGGANHKGGVPTYYFAQFFPKNCTKMKNIWTWGDVPGGRRP